MTNKQYEHLGRAVAAEARLETMSDNMDNLRDELSRELATFCPSEIANAWVTNHYGNPMAQWHNGREFMDAVRQILVEDAKKEKAK